MCSVERRCQYELLLCIINPIEPSPPRNATITRVFQGGVELNWLPPTGPNGEVHYIVGYKREDSRWTSVNATRVIRHSLKKVLKAAETFEPNVSLVSVNEIRHSHRPT